MPIVHPGTPADNAAGPSAERPVAVQPDPGGRHHPAARKARRDIRRQAHRLVRGHPARADAHAIVARLDELAGLCRAFARTYPADALRTLLVTHGLPPAAAGYEFPRVRRDIAGMAWVCDQFAPLIWPNVSALPEAPGAAEGGVR